VRSAYVGLTWSMTVNMKIDLIGPARRGMALGINETARYLGVAVTALATGFGLRPARGRVHQGAVPLHVGRRDDRHRPPRRPDRPLTVGLTPGGAAMPSRSSWRPSSGQPAGLTAYGS
jgi:hypothetical protein